MAPRWAAALALLAGLGCRPATAVTELTPAQLVLDRASIDLGALGPTGVAEQRLVISNTGELALGVHTVELVGDTTAFSLWWEPEGSDTLVPCCTASAQNPLVVLAPDEEVGITARFEPDRPGAHHAAIAVTTIGEREDTETPDVDRYYADWDNARRIAYVSGVGETWAPDALIYPRYVDLGFLLAEEGADAFVTVRNGGDAPLSVQSVSLPGCGDDFEIVSAPGPGETIGPGISKVIEVGFTAASADPTSCQLVVQTSDPERPQAEVTLRANTGGNATNLGPEVMILSPTTGAIHSGTGPIAVELVVDDPDDLNATLTCLVRSALQLAGVLADCTVNEAGYFTVDVPIDGLDPGLEVLMVRVTDPWGLRAQATVPVMINAALPSGDEDGDGFEAAGEDFVDCDDTDAAVYPKAAEVLDGVDNNCDDVTDEGTAAFDDDGDGMTELDGDCWDGDPNTFLGAAEISDGVDNDCDGTIDEGTTAADDDGDGFADRDLDCDDDDPDIAPGMPELCGDGFDNNCNGRIDAAETCEWIDSRPELVGGIDLSNTAIEPLQSTSASVFVYEADGDAITHLWESESGSIDSPSSESVVWTAPDLSAGVDTRVFRLFYTGSDDDQNQVWDAVDIEVVRGGAIGATVRVVGEGEGGCSVAPAGAVGWWAVLALALVRRRRRP